MYNVPCHIKLHVDRIIKEYETMYRQGHKIALQMLRGNRIYSGLETTEYCLKTVKNFRRLLDNPEGELFTGTETDIRKKIYLKICEFYKPLSEEAISRITHQVDCQEQLERALRAAKKNPSTAEDAKNLLWFISNCCVINWGRCDENINSKIFKLVKSEDAFEKLLSRTNEDTTIEITHRSRTDYSKIRIALQTIDIPTMYRKQVRVREFRNFWEGPHADNEFDIEYTIFNMWNDITETGIFYVYIPKN